MPSQLQRPVVDYMYGIKGVSLRQQMQGSRKVRFGKKQVTREHHQNTSLSILLIPRVGKFLYLRQNFYSELDILHLDYDWR